GAAHRLDRARRQLRPSRSIEAAELRAAASTASTTAQLPVSTKEGAGTPCHDRALAESPCGTRVRTPERLPPLAQLSIGHRVLRLRRYRPFHLLRVRTASATRTATRTYRRADSDATPVLDPGSGFAPSDDPGR